MNRLTALGVLASGLLGASGIATAATVSACGPSICYEYNDAQSAIDQFGAPTLVGDGLRFLPTDFLAAARRSVGDRLSTDTFVIDRIYSLSGNDITSITITEMGTYLTNARSGQVTADLSLLLGNNSAIMDFGTANASFARTGKSDGLTPWSLATTISPLDLLEGATSDLALSIQNTLTAARGGKTFIQKSGIFIDVQAVPIPMSGWLVAAGVLGLVRIARRQNRIANA